MDVEQVVLSGVAGLDHEALLELVNTVKLDIDEHTRGNLTQLRRSILRYLNSENVTDRSDGGKSIFYEFYFHLQSMEKIKKHQRVSSMGRALGSPLLTSFSEKFDEDDGLKELLKKEFKIVGKIGSVGQKDTLTFSSLWHQIEAGLKKGYSEREVIEGVIKSIAPENLLRAYLEGQPDLTFSTLNKILRSHFKEKDATTLFASLSTAKQLPTENANEFVIRLMTLRQKIFFTSKEDGHPYSQQLVQRTFQQAVYTGLKNENLRSQLRILLKSENVLDDELLETLTAAVTDESEHTDKFNASRKDVKTAQVKASVTDTDKLPKKNTYLDELTEIKSQLDQIYSVCSIQPNQPSVSNNKTSGGKPSQKSRNKCGACFQNGGFCNHCFRCGSTDHVIKNCPKN